MDKNDSVISFLRACPTFKKHPLFFNFGNVKDSAHQIIAKSDDVSLHKPYIDGSVLKRYTCSVDTYKTASRNPNVDGRVDENVEDIADVQTTMDWVNEQGDERNFPDFGEMCVIDEMKTLSTYPILLGVDTTVTPSIAIYRFDIQIDYIDNSKKIWS